MLLHTAKLEDPLPAARGERYNREFEEIVLTLYDFLQQYGGAAQGLEALSVLGGMAGVAFIGARKYIHNRKDARQFPKPNPTTPVLPSAYPRSRIVRGPVSAPASNAAILDICVLGEAEKIEGAQVRLVARDGNFVSATSGREGEVELQMIEPGPVTLLCAHPNRIPASKRVEASPHPEFVYLPKGDGTGSFIGGSDWLSIPGVEGQINPIYDDLGRLYVHPKGLTINGSANEATHFVLNELLIVQDDAGNRTEIVFRQVVGQSFLIEH